MRSMVSHRSGRTADAIFSLFHLRCASCSDIDSELMKLAGVRRVSVDFAANAVLVNYDPDWLSVEDIRKYLEKVSQTS